MINLKAGNRDMRKRDLNFIILGHDLHKNEVSFIFENFILNPTLKGTLLTLTLTLMNTQNEEMGS